VTVNRKAPEQCLRAERYAKTLRSTLPLYLLKNHGMTAKGRGLPHTQNIHLERKLHDCNCRLLHTYLISLIHALDPKHAHCLASPAAIVTGPPLAWPISLVCVVSQPD
jgi:hypothetical protein